MTYNPDWDPYLDEIRRMPEIEITVGPDTVKVHHVAGSAIYYVLKKDWTHEIEKVALSLNANAQYITLEKDDERTHPAVN